MPFAFIHNLLTISFPKNYQNNLWKEVSYALISFIKRRPCLKELSEKKT
jgi:hypothetical protein